MTKENIILLELDDRDTAEAIANMLQLVEHPRPALEEIGDYLVTSTKDRFPKGIAPSGEPWARNTALTLSRKKGTRPLIGESGRLGREIVPFADDAFVEVGSNEPYARPQQFGAKARSFKGGKSPWGDIPARPFLGLSKDDSTAVLDIVSEHLRPAD